MNPWTKRNPDLIDQNTNNSIELLKNLYRINARIANDRGQASSYFQEKRDVLGPYGEVKKEYVSVGKPPVLVPLNEKQDQISKLQRNSDFYKEKSLEALNNFDNTRRILRNIEQNQITSNPSIGDGLDMQELWFYNKNNIQPRRFPFAQDGSAPKQYTPNYQWWW